MYIMKITKEIQNQNIEAVGWYLYPPRWQTIVGPTLGNGWSCWQRIIVGVLTLAQHGSNTKVSTVEV